MKRKYLTKDEMNTLLLAISNNMKSFRDYCMVSMAFIHGLRVSELTNLKIEDYDPLSQNIYIRRLKGGLSTSQPLLSEENSILLNWLNERKNLPGRDLPWIFLSNQGKKISRQRFYQLVRNYGRLACLPLDIHPHMLRHSCGYGLADLGNDTRLIQDYLGHKNIRHTVTYTVSNAARFKNVWVRT
ncbi:tyrosine-type DNA invertase [Enterobacter cloacae]|uniref:tyrosine-type DNA invertase n=1 Tax=Enterobacter cloacae TaxID=550 RepID=UPI00188BE71F|nr:tyrosine-type DNA invertase [Enterobacter cloacae]MBF4114157.1 tyrosine-type recombinase/integrase [Enterobacter cloacae]